LAPTAAAERSTVERPGVRSGFEAGDLGLTGVHLAGLRSGSGRDGGALGELAEELATTKGSGEPLVEGLTRPRQVSRSSVSWPPNRYGRILQRL
jgi:hypothetical protein